MRMKSGGPMGLILTQCNIFSQVGLVGAAAQLNVWQWAPHGRRRLATWAPFSVRGKPALRSIIPMKSGGPMGLILTQPY